MLTAGRAISASSLSHGYSRCLSRGWCSARRSACTPDVPNSPGFSWRWSRPAARQGSNRLVDARFDASTRTATRNSRGGHATVSRRVLRRRGARVCTRLAVEPRSLRALTIGVAIVFGTHWPSATPWTSCSRLAMAVAPVGGWWRVGGGASGVLLWALAIVPVRRFDVPMPSRLRSIGAHGLRTIPVRFCVPTRWRSRVAMHVLPSRASCARRRHPFAAFLCRRRASPCGGVLAVVVRPSAVAGEALRRPDVYASHP